MSPMKYADQLWSIIIRSIGRCELRGAFLHKCQGALQGMHLDGRTNYDLRHELFNGICGCQGAHTYWTYKSKTSKGQREWEKYLSLNFPEKYRKVFVEEHERIIKRDYKKIAQELEGIIRVVIFNHTYADKDQRVIDRITKGETK